MGKFVAPLVWNRMVSGSTDYLADQYHILDRYVKRPSMTMAMNGASARIYEGFIVNYLRDRNPMWKTMVLQGVKEWVDSFESHVSGSGEEYGNWGGDNPSSIDSMDPWKLEILLLAYKHLGYAPALAVMQRYTTFVRKYSQFFGADYSFQDDHHDSGTGHFHIHALFLQAFLDLAVLTQDTDLREWVRKTYARAKSPSAYAVDLVGFFPELVWRSDGNPQGNSEGCVLADMVTLPIKLAKAGAGDSYWDDADRYARNHWAESQLTKAFGDALQAYSNANGDESPPEHPEWCVSSNQTDVSGRSRGGFAGWPAINNWRQQEQEGIQQCCTGNGSRSIYFVWDNIVSYTGGVLRVNLLLNRASAQVDVYSHIPYVGKVEVRAKQALGDVRIRIPSWVGAGLQVKVNGSARAFTWDGRYIKVGALASGDRVSVTFTMSESTVTQNIAHTNVTFTKRGNTIVDISPKGEIAGLYQRSRYRSSPAPMVTVQRFVSSEIDLGTRVDDTWKLPVQSSSGPGDSDHLPENMTDGDLDSSWIASSNGTAAVLDMGREYTVVYVAVAFPNGEEAVDTIDVQVSKDNRTWTTVKAGFQSSGLTSKPQAFKVSQTSGRYLKVVARGSSTGAGNTISELEIWGKSGSTPAVLSAAASASRSDSGTSPAKTQDNDLNTRWSASGVGQWIMFDLGALKTVAGVDLAVYQGDSEVQYFDIETRGDTDEDWMRIYRGQSSGASTALQSFDVPNVAARQVRIVGRGRTGSTLNALTEVRIKGY